MTAAPEPGRFTVLSRVLHWLTAILVFCALFIGFAMVNSLGDYATLILIHWTLGITILAVVLVRVVNRFTHHPPPWPPTVGRLEGKIVALSERLLYAELTRRSFPVQLIDAGADTDTVRAEITTILWQELTLRWRGALAPV